MYTPVLGTERKTTYTPVLGVETPTAPKVAPPFPLVYTSKRAYLESVKADPTTVGEQRQFANLKAEEFVKTMGKAVGQGIGRSYLGAGQALIAPFQGATLETMLSTPFKQEPANTELGKITRTLSGTDEDISLKKEDVAFLGEDYGELAGGKFSVALLGLDLLGGGGVKGALLAIKEIKGAKEIGDAMKITKGLGIVDDIGKQYWNKIVLAKSAKESKNILEAMAKLQTTTKPTYTPVLGEIPGKTGLAKVGLAPEVPAKITRSEDVLLREKMRQQATGAKAGLKAGKAEGVLEGTAKTSARYETQLARLKLVTIKAVQTLKNKAFDVAKVKQTITDYAKEKLDLDLRGRLLSAVNSATTRGDVAKAILRVNKLRNEEIKQEIVSSIEKFLDKADILPPNQLKKVLEITDRLTTDTFSKATQAKLEALKEFLVKEPKALYRFGPKTIKKTERAGELGKQKISDIALRDLFKINDRLEHLAREGELVTKTTKEIKGLRVDNALKEIKESGARNLDEGLPPPRKPGTPESTMDFAGARDSTIEGMRTGRQWYGSTDMGFSILDNDVMFGANYRIFARPLHNANGLSNEMRGELLDHLFAKIDDIEKRTGTLTIDRYENVLMYATLRQVGGRAKLMKSDPRLFTEAFLDSIKLDEGEMEFYKLGREIFDELRPHIERVLYVTKGEKLGKVDNYWSWITDFDNSDELFMRLSGDYKNTSRTEQGFTKKRLTATGQKLNLNALDVLVNHINDASIYIHQEELLNQLGKIASSEKYANTVGKLGQKWVVGWIDLLARGGVPKGYKPSGVTLLIRNIGHGVLGFRLSPIVKQPLAKIVSAGFLGKDTFLGTKEFFSDSAIRDAIHNVSKQQKFRNFDDPSYTKLAKSKRLATWQKWGYLGIKTFDSWTADSVWYAAYRKNIKDRGLDFSFSIDDFKAGKNIDDDAKEYADLIVRKTQGSSEYKDAPLMYAVAGNKDYVMAFLQFQRFIHYQSLLWRDAKIALTKEKDPIKAASIASALIATGIAESYITTGFAQIFSSDDVAEKQREKSISSRVFNTITGQLPVVSNLVSIATFGGTGVPVWDVARQGWQGAISTVTAKKPETKIKGAIRATEAGASFAGLSGAGQIGQILRKFVPESPTKTKGGGLPKKQGSSSGGGLPKKTKI